VASCGAKTVDSRPMTSSQAQRWSAMRRFMVMSRSALASGPRLSIGRNQLGSLAARQSRDRGRARVTR
jgi:hypothetical protein